MTKLYSQFSPILIYIWILLSVWFFNAEVYTIFFACLIEIWVLIVLLLIVRCWQFVFDWKKFGFMKMLATMSLKSPNLLTLTIGALMLSFFQWILIAFTYGSEFRNEFEIAHFFDSLFTGDMRWVALLTCVIYILNMLTYKGFKLKNEYIENSFILEVVAFFMMNCVAVIVTNFKLSNFVVIAMMIMARWGTAYFFNRVK